MSRVTQLIRLYEAHNVCLRCKWRIFRKGRAAAEVASPFEVIQKNWDEFKSKAEDEYPSEENATAEVSTIEEVSESKDDKGNCLLCLGLLSDCTLSFIKNKICEEVSQKQFHDADQPYSLFITLPHITTLRQASFLKFVTETLKTTPGNEILNDCLQLKDAFKYCISPQINKELGRDQIPESSLTVHAMIMSDEDKVCNELVEKHSKVSKRSRKRRHGDQDCKATINSIQAVIDSISTVDAMNKLYPCPPSASTGEVTVDVQVKMASVYFAGRYRKLSRSLSQTPWVIDGARHGETSVQELICNHIQEQTGAEELKFMSSGREDVDVRMLGKGRPFAVQFINPRRTKFSQEELANMEKVINASTKDVEVQHLQIIDKEALSVLKEGEESKRKHYSATVVVPTGINVDLDKLNTDKEIQLAQKTPLRVLHRRPSATRMRAIYAMTAKKIDEFHFTLKLTTQAGTYVKEFVHGDFGRTKPSVGDLLSSETDIVDLDVEDVELEWPPNIRQG